MSAPMPRARCAVSSIMPWLRPTRLRIRVTGTPISRMLSRLRIGGASGFRGRAYRSLGGSFSGGVAGADRLAENLRAWCLPAGRAQTYHPVTPLLMSILTMSMTTPYSSRGRLISMCFGNGDVVVGLSNWSSGHRSGFAVWIEDQLPGESGDSSRLNQMVRLSRSSPAAVLADEVEDVDRRCPRR